MLSIFNKCTCITVFTFISEIFIIKLHSSQSWIQGELQQVGLESEWYEFSRTSNFGFFICCKTKNTVLIFNLKSFIQHTKSFLKLDYDMFKYEEEACGSLHSHVLQCKLWPKQLITIACRKKMWNIYVRQLFWSKKRIWATQYTKQLPIWK